MSDESIRSMKNGAIVSGDNLLYRRGTLISTEECSVLYLIPNNALPVFVLCLCRLHETWMRAPGGSLLGRFRGGTDVQWCRYPHPRVGFRACHTSLISRTSSDLQALNVPRARHSVVTVVGSLAHSFSAVFYERKQNRLFTTHEKYHIKDSFWLVRSMLVYLELACMRSSR